MTSTHPADGKASEADSLARAETGGEYDLLRDHIRKTPQDLGFFFVTGAHRTGTSWMRWLLDSHPQVSVSYESYFFHPRFGAGSWLNTKNIERWTNHPNEDAANRKQLCNHLLGRPGESNVLAALAERGAVEAMLRLLWKPGVRAIGDKSPVMYLSRAPQIHRLFPDASIINMVRDGRDAAVSLMFLGMRFRQPHIYANDDAALQHRLAFFQRDEGEACDLFTEASLRYAINEWSGCNRDADRAAAIFQDQYLAVRYEDLLSDTSGQLENVLRQIDVDRSPSVVARCIESASFSNRSGDGRPQGVEDRTAFVRKGIAGDWQNYFTERDKDLFKELAGQQLIDLGYEQDLDW